MIIDGVNINATCEEVLKELQQQLKANQIPYLQKMHDSGRNIQVQCPYHGDGQEHRPSAGIRKSDGVFHCFACGQAHTLAEVISFCFGHDDFGYYGNKWLVRNFATIQVEERKDVEIDMERHNTSNKNSILDSDIYSESIPTITEKELDSYRYYHPYWTKRGITEDWLLELFDLGYDIRTDCITFPVRDITGRCLFVARRNVRTKWFNYPKNVEKPLYGLYELQSVDDCKKLYITESMIDCLLLWQEGKYAVALNGLGSEGQIAAIKRLPIRQVVLTTDNDNAGIRARNRVKKSIKNKLITEVNFPQGIKDVGECTKEQIQNIERWEVFA